VDTNKSKEGGGIQAIIIMEQKGLTVAFTVRVRTPEEGALKIQFLIV
jgi:hypothetical protein